VKDMTSLEGWGFVSVILISAIGSYMLGASLKQLYEDRVEPKWLNTLCIVLATAGTCAGTALAVLWAVST
jgi:hypothetical protein